MCIIVARCDTSIQKKLLRWQKVFEIPSQTKWIPLKLWRMAQWNNNALSVFVWVLGLSLELYVKVWYFLDRMESFSFIHQDLWSKILFMGVRLRSGYSCKVFKVFPIVDSKTWFFITRILRSAMTNESACAIVHDSSEEWHNLCPWCTINCELHVLA